MKSPMNYQLVLSHMLQACQQGRQVLLKYFGNLAHVEEKFQAGLVSEADKAAEKTIFQYLQSFYPEVALLGEESFADDPETEKLTRGKPRWILDPLDGTTNYIHQFPVFCISLALEIDNEIQIGVIDMPILKETYTCIKGQGSFVNGQKISVSKTATLKNSLLATGFFHEIEENLQEQLIIFSSIVRKCRGIRRAGAAAYDLAQVARGVFDGYWEKDLKPWDSAAGILLVREAGGTVLTYKGEPYTPYHRSLVAGNAQITDQVIKIISG